MTKVHVLLSLGLLLTVQLYSAQGQQDEDVTNEDEESLIEVATPSGRILGKQEETEKGTRYYSFLGIPYAEPPLGRLRFKDPVPKTPWIDGEPLNATQFGSQCLQLGFLPGDNKVSGSEDCLFLNIWTPRLSSVKERRQPKSSFLPVFVYIHGGGFFIGSGKDYPGTLFMEKDVIYVSLNYRLGPFGFLSLGNSHISGNQGIKDQLLALKWIQSNIHAFGGDSSKVTISGESAGSVSVTLHQISPLGHGLYRNVIAMSGTALIRPHAVLTGFTEKQGHRYLSVVGCERDLLSEVLSCLENQDSDVLMSVERETFDLNRNRELSVNGTGPFFWMPTVDAHANVPFMPEHPYLLLAKRQQKNIPLILGFVENESGMFADSFLEHADTLNANWSYHGPNFIYLAQPDEITPDHQLAADTLRHFYTGVSGNFTQENKAGLYDFFSDLFFLSSGQKMAEIVSQGQSQPVYMYIHKGRPSVSFKQLLNPEEELEDVGLTHGDDLFFLFKEFGGVDGLTTEESQTTSDKVLTVFTNLAKYDDPTPFREEGIPVWQPWTRFADNYLELKEQPEMKTGFFPTRMFVWEKFFWEPLVVSMMAA